MDFVSVHRRTCSARNSIVIDLGTTAPQTKLGTVMSSTAVRSPKVICNRKCHEKTLVKIIVELVPPVTF
jgi:hypothetical protein